MKYLKYIIAIIFILLLHFLSTSYNFINYKYETAMLFSLILIVLMSFIIVLSFRCFAILKTFDNIFFSVSYSVMLIFMIIILTQSFSYRVYNEYYFNLLKYFEITIFYFSLFILKEILKIRKFDKDLIIIAIIDAIYFVILLKYKCIILLAPLLYVELMYLYNKMEKRDLRFYFMSVLFYKMIAQILLEATIVKGLEYLYILSFLAYIYSLIKMILYFNENLNNGYFRQMLEKEKKIKKILGVSSEGFMIVSGYFIKKVNQKVLDFFGFDNRSDIEGRNLFSFFEGLKIEELQEALKKYPHELDLNFRRYGEKQRKLKVKAYKTNIYQSEELIFVLKDNFSIETLFYKLNDESKQVNYIIEEGIGYRYINKCAKDLLGYPIGEFYKNPSFSSDIIHPDDYNEYIKLVKMREAKSFADLRYIKKDGEIVWVKESISRKIIEGKSYFYGTMTEITELKKSEVDLRNKNIDLEAQNIKKEMNMSIVSHEIRTPITAIIGFIETLLLNKKNMDTKHIKVVNKVYSNSIRLKELVNNLLDLNKLNAGKLEIYPENIAINSIIEETLINNEMLMEIKNIELENRISETYIVNLDATMFYQIMNNLLSNAIKYNKESGKIIIDAYKDGRKVTISIKDTGYGIHPENREKVFKEYERAKGLKEKGTGLGLPLSKKLVELNGGTIFYESEIDVGTTFYISFIAKGDDF